MRHEAVLKEEALSSLNLATANHIVDGTIGDGGHSQMILENSNASVLGIDKDPEAILRCGKFLGDYADRVTLVRDSFANIAQVVADNDFGPVDGVLLDLGWSTPQFEERGRGFSFAKDEPLDMRYDGLVGNGEALTAAKIIKSYSVKDLVLIFSRYGGEGNAEGVARAVASARRKKEIKTTAQLVEIIEGVYKGKRGKIHPATKVFQALRIVVNDEYEQLREGLKGAVEVLTKGGHLAVITFHSGEDRIVKRFIDAHPQLKSITKRPIIAAPEELALNNKARSAKLRVAEKS